MKRQQEQKALSILMGAMVLLVIGTAVYLFVRNGDFQDSGISSAQKAYTEGGEGATARSTTPSDLIFDPNTADSATLVSVGLSPFQARNVLRYRAKGGQYHRPEDFKRLYGLTVSQWEHLAPLIRIGREFQYLADVTDVSPSYPRSHYRYRNGGTYSTGKGTVGEGVHGQREDAPLDSALHSTRPFRSNAYPVKLKKGETVDLSRCDTSDLKRIPGVGSYYAKRIAEYSKRLGGFVSLNQLNDEELSFLPIGIEQYVALKSPSIHKLRINQVTLRELNAHPYVTYSQAKQVVSRIRLYGPLSSFDDLLILSEFSEADISRLKPYIEF